MVGANSNIFTMKVGDILDFSMSVILVDKKTCFNWKLVVVYGSPYEEGKHDFLLELHQVMSKWQGPIMVGGDFNLVRFFSDKNNGRIKHRWADAFNEWVTKWALMELNASNRLHAWTNNQDNLLWLR